MEVPIIVKLNQLKWKKRQMHRTYYLRIEMNRTYELEKQRNKMNGQKYKKTEPKPTKQQEHRTKFQGIKLKTRTIEREGRKEKRKLMKMDVWLDDHATRRMETPR